MEFLGVIGSALGGGTLGVLARLLPEIMNWFNKKTDNAHELAMFDKQIAADYARSQQAIHQSQIEGQFALDAAGLDALKDAIRGQVEMAAAAGGWAATISALVRPYITGVLMTLYVIAKGFVIYAAMQSGLEPDKVAAIVYDTNDIALLTGIVNFWFLDRVIKQQK